MKRGEDERRAREEAGGGLKREEVERVNKWQWMKGGGGGGGRSARVRVNGAPKTEGEIRSWRRRRKEEGGEGECEGQQSVE